MKIRDLIEALKTPDLLEDKKSGSILDREVRIANGPGDVAVLEILSVYYDADEDCVWIDVEEG